MDYEDAAARINALWTVFYKHHGALPQQDFQRLQDANDQELQKDRLNQIRSIAEPWNILLLKRAIQRQPTTALDTTQPSILHILELPTASNYPPSSRLGKSVTERDLFLASEPSGIPMVPSTASIHLFVFVHGLAGSSFDFRQYCSYLAQPPRAHQSETTVHVYLQSRANQNATLDPFEVQADRLVSEIEECIRKQGAAPHRVSFIAHSQGGLVVRAALPKLHKFRDCMQTLVSFATYALFFLS
jgi:triacylglycerol esterase/lipase EstA (alpha/beta hydrolase family)